MVKCFMKQRYKEPPAVAEYADSEAEAHLLAMDTIATTIEIFAEQKRNLMLP